MPVFARVRPAAPPCACLRALFLLAACSLGAAAAGCGGSGERPPYVPFEAAFPTLPPGGPRPGEQATPPPTPPRTPAWAPDALTHARSVLLGSFPSDVWRFGDTLFVTDADQLDAQGLAIVPVDTSGPSPVLSPLYATVRLSPAALRDSAGNPADPANPIGFGYYANDLLVVDDRLGFALVGAGGSDSTPTLSNLVAFDPTSGGIRQVVDLANRYVAPTALVDSTGAAVPGGSFVQSGAEGLGFVPTGAGRGRLYVAMTNLVFGAPSYGTVKYPGTLQIFDVTVGATAPVAARPVGTLATETILVGDYNPVAVTTITPDAGPFGGTPSRVLVTVAGATAFDAQGSLVPSTDASVRAYEGASGTFLGTFRLGLSGLSATRPAIGRDGAGHRVGFFPSASTGQVYLLRLDGLFAAEVDPSAVAVLRGPDNGIPIEAGQAGSPGGNIAGIGLSPDGRTLAVAGFGNLFAFPAPLPGRLYLLNLPGDLLTGSGLGVDFLPGATEYAVTPGRALGTLVLVPNSGQRPDVYVNVSGPIDGTTFLGAGPASLGTLQTFGLIR